jgi:ATP-binding cassette subfamily C protein
MLVGVWQPLRGKVRIDGAALDQWDRDTLGCHIGYMAQSVELFDGTVADNISRFAEDTDSGSVIEAAEAAGIKDMILRLPEGFQTPIGEGGMALSAGQRQLVGLARALYGNPFLVVLDEPNSNLDADGDTALGAAIRNVRQRGGIALVIAHRPSALLHLDLVMVMADGAIKAFGPKEDGLAQMTRQAPPPAAPATPAERGPIVVPLHDRR